MKNMPKIQPPSYGSFDQNGFRPQFQGRRVGDLSTPNQVTFGWVELCWIPMKKLCAQSTIDWTSSFHNPILTIWASQNCKNWGFPTAVVGFQSLGLGVAGRLAPNALQCSCLSRPGVDCKVRRCSPDLSSINKHDSHDHVFYTFLDDRNWHRDFPWSRLITNAGFPSHLPIPFPSLCIDFLSDIINNTSKIS